MLYMILERFRDDDALPVYRRLRDEGRIEVGIPEPLAAIVHERDGVVHDHERQARQRGNRRIMPFGR